MTAAKTRRIMTEDRKLELLREMVEIILTHLRPVRKCTDNSAATWGPARYQEEVEQAAALVRSAEVQLEIALKLLGGGKEDEQGPQGERHERDGR